MRKLFMSLFSILTALVLLSGCSNDSASQNQEMEESQETSEVQEDSITVTISEDEGAEVLTEKEIEIEEGAILMDVMKDNFDIKEEGGFITAIDGVEANDEEQTAWMYFVNDEMAMVGAAEYELEAEDHIVFDLQAWE